MYTASFEQTLADLLQTIAFLDNRNVEQTQLLPDFDSVNQLVLAGVDWILFDVGNIPTNETNVPAQGLLTIVTRYGFHSHVHLSHQRRKLIPCHSARNYEIRNRFQ